MQLLKKSSLHRQERLQPTAVGRGVIQWTSRSDSKVGPLSGSCVPTQKREAPAYASCSAKQISSSLGQVTCPAEVAYTYGVAPLSRSGFGLDLKPVEVARF